MTQPSDTGRRDDLMTVRALLDDALVGLRAIADPAVAVRDARDAVASALEHVYRALASWADYAALQAEAKTALERCRDALGALQHRETEDQGALADIALVAQALGALRSSARAPADIVLDLPRPHAAGTGTDPTRPVVIATASRDEPRELDVARDVLPPAVLIPDLGAPPPPSIDTTVAPSVPIASIDDLERYADETRSQHAAGDDEAAPPHTPATEPAPLPPFDPSTAFGVAWSESQLRRRRAEGFFEELATMSVMRQADPGDVWFELEPVEQRLLARIDALIACGADAFTTIRAMLDERPVPDPELVWAALTFFGCLRGSDALDQVRRLARSIDLANETMFDAVTDALTYAPNRDIESLARDLAHQNDALTRAAGVRILGRRAAWTMTELVGQLEEAPEPAELREIAAALLTAHGPLDMEALRRLLASRDPTVFRAAARSGLGRGQLTALSQARIHTDQGRATFGDAALWCALAGDEADVRRVLDAAARDDSELLVEALGWTGYVPAVPFLLGRLEAGSEQAVHALQRITGASLVADAPLPAYDEEEGARPFGDDHRPWEHELTLSDDPEPWRAWWNAYGGRADARRRYRFGHAWSPLDNLFEMERAAGDARTRRLAHIELVARTGIELPFDPRAFVVRQRRQINEWREALAVRRDRAISGVWRHRLS